MKRYKYLNSQRTKVQYSRIKNYLIITYLFNHYMENFKMKVFF